MAKAIRKKTPQATGLPPVLTRFLDGLSTQPSSGKLAVIAMLLTVALYSSGLGYPLVFADFAVLGPEQLANYARTAPSFGSRWLADASFGWSAKLLGTAWPWHRTINLILHVLNVGVAFALFRRFCLVAPTPGAGTLAGGWVAFFAAVLLALHPVAVYGVAYLSERASLLLGLFASVALWSTARAAQDGWRGAWVIGPIACAGALACGQTAIAIPLAMAFVAIILGRRAGGPRRHAWVSVGLSAAIAIVYAAGYATQVGSGEGQRAATADAFALASGRFLDYLGFWLIPVTGWMAAEMPEPLAPAFLTLPGFVNVVLLGVFIAAVAATLWRKGAASTAALGLACVLVLYLAELAGAGLSQPFALSRSYAWMGLVCLALASLLARLPAKAGFAAGCVMVFVWTLLAVLTLKTFETHVALWDDAVRRVERVGPSAADARIYLNRAAVHRRDGHLLAAIADYDKALALVPDQARALRGRAQAYIDDKRYELALKDLDRLLELEPAQAIIHADRGLVLMQAGRLPEAGNAFDRAIALGVKEPKVFLNRGLARLQINGLEAAPAALADIERALELDRRYALAYFNRALVFEEAAKAGLRLRDAVSPEIMRAVAQENMKRACEFGHAPACSRDRSNSMQDAQDAPPGAREGPVRVTPESLRRQGLPPVQ